MNDKLSENDTDVKHTIIHQEALRLSANLIESNGWLIANDYGSVIDEYKAFKEKPVLIDFSDNGVVRISGTDSKEFLLLFIHLSIPVYIRNHRLLLS